MEERYELQIHGEWSGRDDVADESFFAETLEEIRKAVAEVPYGVLYQILEDGAIIEEARREKPKPFYYVDWEARKAEGYPSDELEYRLVRSRETGELITIHYRNRVEYARRPYEGQ